MRFFLVALLLFFGTNVLSQKDDRITRLKNRILKNQKKIEELESQTKEKEQYTLEYTKKIIDSYLKEPATAEEGVTAGYNKGFFVTSADGNFELQIRGFLRYHLFLAEFDTVQNNTFRLTNTRFDFNVFLYKDWHVRIHSDFSNGANDNVASGLLVDTYIEYLGNPNLKPRIGQFHVPFLMEVQQNPADFLVINNTPFAVAGGVPARDVGIMLYGSGLPLLDGEFLSNYFTYKMGVYNGDNLRRANFDDDILIGAQTRFYPLGAKEKNTFIHVGGFYNHRGFVQNGAQIRLPALVNPNQVVFLNVGNDNVADINGDQGGVDVAFSYQKDNVRIELEGLWVELQRDNEDANNLPFRVSPLYIVGGSAAASYYITLEDEETGERNYLLMGFEPLFRVSYTTIDDRNEDDSFAGGVGLGTQGDVQRQSVWEIVLGVKLYANEHVRFDFNWVMYDLKETSSGVANPAGFNNSDRQQGGGLLHSFVFQFLARF